MRKQQYIATVACLVAGFVSVYATDKGKERREAEQEIAEQTQQEAPASYEVKPEISVEDATKKAEEQALKLAEQEKIKQEETQQDRHHHDVDHIENFLPRGALDKILIVTVFLLFRDGNGGHSARSFLSE